MTENFIYFTCEKLIKKDDTKMAIGLPKGWNKITKDNYEKYVITNHKVKCVLTGKTNNITVFDFDDNKVYFETIKKYPELEKCYTIKTNKGFHIYTKYNEKYETTTNTNKKIDIRNDGAMVFGNGTKTEFDTEYTIHHHGRLDIEAPIELYNYIKPVKPLKIKKKIKNPSVEEYGKNEIVEPIQLERNLKNDLLNNINLEFWTNRHDWMRLVWCMRNLNYDYETIKYFSKKAPNYTDAGFDNIYNAFTEKKEVGIGTIKYYSRMSDPNEYVNIISTYSDYVDPKDDYAIAHKFLELNEGQIFMDTQRKCWYIYRNGKWCRDDEGHNITLYMYEDLKKYVEKIIHNEAIKSIESDSDSDSDDEDNKKKSKTKKKIKNLKKIKDKVISASYSKQIFSILKGHNEIQVSEFPFDINDEQKYNIHFKNCCYEYKTDTTRDRTKEDLISYTLSYDYDPKIYGEQETKFIDTFFKKIEPNDKLREMLLSYLSLALTGETKHQKFLCMVGTKASNGKSTIFKIMSKCFPLYVEKIDKSAFLKSGEQTRHKILASLIDRPIRFCYIEELGNKGIDNDFLKDFTDNNGLIKIKKLYGTEIKIKNQSKLAFASNCSPNLQIDEGIKRRLLVQELESQFLDVDEDDWENRIFKKDEDILDIFNDDKWKICLFDYLMKYKNFKIPDEIYKMTNKVIDELDHVKQIILDNFIISNNNDDYIMKTELEYFCKNNDEMKEHGIKEKDIITKLKDGLKIKYNKNKYIKDRSMKRGAFVGIRERNENDEEED